MDIDEDVENLEEETKYKIKLDAPKSEPAFGGSDDSDFGGGFGDEDGEEDAFGGDDGGDFGEEGGDKPFDAEPFDAGVEADEDEDPEKYIQQLAGKIGTSIRKYNDERGEPDFDLEKYAINSVISASHTSEMDEEDQKDIIRKVKTSGASDDNDDIDKDLDEPADNEGGFGDEEPTDDEGGFGDEGGLEEDGGDLPSLTHNPDDFAGDDIRRYYDATVTRNRDGLTGKVLRFDDGKLKVKITNGEHAGKLYFSYPDEVTMIKPLSEEDTLDINLKNMKQDAEDILSMDKESRNNKLKGHKWADDHISTSADDAEEVADFLTNEGDNPCWDGYDRVPGTKKGAKGSCKKKTSESIQESEYQGKNVELNKPMKGDVKKFKVYVKNDKGNVVKVNFGDKNMEIKRDDPKARKSFRARHKCDQKKDKTSAGYWSCKMWSSKSVSDILKESEKNSTFVENKDMKTLIKVKLNEMAEPATKPAPVKTPTTTPTKKPRRTRIFQPNPGVKVPAKMKGNGTDIK